MENQATAPPELRKVVDWLRNKSGMKVRTGVLAGKRHDYFKGRSASKALLSPAYAKLKGVPTVTDDATASALLHSLIPHTFFLLVARSPSSTPNGPKTLQINPNQAFVPDEYFVWLVDANPLRSLVIAFGAVVLVLAAVMFPLWPVKLRIGVWYLSIGVLGLIGLFFAIAIFRLILYVVTLVVAKPGIWLYPNLFADVGFVDSFIPLWAWDLPPPKKVKGAKKPRKEGKGGGTPVSGAQTPITDQDGPRISEIADDE